MTYPDIGGAIRVALLANSGVSAIVGGDVNAGKVFPNQAPSWADLPYILFYSAGGGHMNQQKRNSLNVLWRVESRAESDGVSSARAKTLALHQAVEAALHKQELTLSGWGNYWLMCSNTMEFLEQPKDGKQYYRMVWDVEVRAAEVVIS